MSKRLMICVGAALLALAITAGALWFMLRRPEDPEGETAQSPIVTGERPSATADRTPIAYVGEWEGRVAVYRGGSATPDEVLDVFVSTLPPSEQAALAKRVAVFDEVELQKLLEDYTG